MSATRDGVREAVAAAIYETSPRIQAPESPAPKWADCKTRYRREWYRCADAAIAAAEQAGWVLVPVEANEATEWLREAVGELERAWSFHDRVVASSPAERSAVGQDHYNWCERAARNAIRALQP